MAISNSRQSMSVQSGSAELRDLGHVVEGLGLLGVVPGPDHLVALDGRVRPGVGLGRDVRAVGVGDVDALAVDAEGPAVEGAAQALPLDLAADTQVRAQVRAVGVDEAGLARRRPVEDQVLGEQVERPGLARGQVGGPGHDEPAVGHGEREAAARLAGDLETPGGVQHQLGVPGHGEADEGLDRGRLAGGGGRGVLEQVGDVGVSHGPRGPPVVGSRRGCPRRGGRCARPGGPAPRCRCRRGPPHCGRGSPGTRPGARP